MTCLVQLRAPDWDGERHTRESRSRPRDFPIAGHSRPAVRLHRHPDAWYDRERNGVGTASTWHDRLPAKADSARLLRINTARRSRSEGRGKGSFHLPYAVPGPATARYFRGIQKPRGVARFLPRLSTAGRNWRPTIVREQPGRARANDEMTAIIEGTRSQNATADEVDRGTREAGIACDPRSSRTPDDH